MHAVTASEAATGFVTTAAKLGRMNADALSEIANVAKGTPFAPMFKANAVMASVAVEGLERLVGQLGTGPVVVAPEFDEAAEAAKAAPVAAEPAPAVVDEPVAKAPVATAEAPAAAEDADLTAIDGVGPATMRKLKDAGIVTVADLAGYDAAKLERVLENAGLRMTRFSPSDWIEQAQAMTA